MRKSSPASLLILLAAVLVAMSGAPLTASGGPFPVRNINTSGASTPTDLVTMGGFTYFVADNGANGMELWRSDGTQAGTTLVKDICGGACNSWPYQLTVVPLAGGERLFFAADNGVDGYELWKSDGTTAGTVMVKNISGTGSAEVDLLTVVGNELFFRVKDEVAGRELWKSDGTAAGTVMVKDIFTGNGNSTPSDLVAMGGTLFFSALDNPLGRELWKSNGTAAGTVAVKDINPGGGRHRVPPGSARWEATSSSSPTRGPVTVREETWQRSRRVRGCSRRGFADQTGGIARAWALAASLREGELSPRCDVGYDSRARSRAGEIKYD